MQPPAAPTTFPSVATTTGIPNPEKPKTKKGPIAAIIGVAITVIVIAVAAVVAVQLTTVSHADYAAAQEQTQALADAVDSESSAGSVIENAVGGLESGTVSQDDLNEISTTFKDLRSTVKTKIDEIGKAKAITKDSDAKAKYDKLVEAANKYDETLALAEEMYSADGMGPFILASNDIVSLTTEANTTPTTLTEYIAFYQKMADVFKKASDSTQNIEISNEELKASIKAMGETYGKMATLMTDLIAALNSGDAAKASELQTQSNTLASEMTKAVSDMEDAIENMDLTNVEQDFADAINDLGEYLTDKANGQ